MSTLDFKLEYFKKPDSDEGVYIQLRSDIPAYITQITKEEYVGLPPSQKHEFITNLFSVPGVVVLSCQAYRVYLEKSPVYGWSEILSQVIEQVRIGTEHDEINELPGSPTYLDTIRDRRPTT